MIESYGLEKRRTCKRHLVFVDAAVENFTIVSGSGRWKEVVGVKCIGAYSQIAPFEIGTLENATAMCKGKCDVADKTLDRLINYKN